METPDITTLTDAELISKTVSAIYGDAVMSSRGRFSQSIWDDVNACHEECRRRTPNGHLYQIAYNRAATGIIDPGPVPPDERVTNA